MRSARLLVPALLAPVVLAGCFTGERGHLVDAPVTPTTTAASATTQPPLSDAAMQAVVAKLETPNIGQFTATYDILIKLGITNTTATVAQLTTTSQSITVGHVRFLTEAAQTCELSTQVCVAGLQDQQISDTQLPHNFYSLSAALKLRQDVNTMVSPATASTRPIVGLVATCVEVHFAAGNKTYCALDTGLLAEQDTPDVKIELTSYTNGADPNLFAIP